jgi:glycosyltransferase involved in cell wall biosynthesis
MVDTVFFIGPLPPPMNGAAMTSQGFLDALRTYAAIRTYNIAPDAKRRGGLTHFVKPLRVIWAIIGVIASAWRRKKAIYTALDGGFGLIYGIVTAAAARLCGYRIYMHHHSFSYINFPSGLLRLLANIAGPEATHILLCPLMAERIQQVYPAIKKVRVVDSTAFVPQTQPYQKKRGTELRVGLLSNLNAEKGLDISIALLRQSLQQGLPVRLILAGRAHDAAAKVTLDAAIAEFGDHIDYLGPISDEEKDTYLRNLDVFLFPTQYINEAQPRVILEALSYAVPVITRARSCIPGDVADAGVCIAEHLDFVETAIPALRRWIDDPASLATTSDRAIQRSRELHANARRQLDAAAREITGF